MTVCAVLPISLTLNPSPGGLIITHNFPFEIVELGEVRA